MNVGISGEPHYAAEGAARVGQPASSWPTASPSRSRPNQPGEGDIRKNVIEPHELECAHADGSLGRSPWECTPVAPAAPGTCRTWRLPEATPGCPAGSPRSQPPSVRPRPWPRPGACAGTPRIANAG